MNTRTKWLALVSMSIGSVACSSGASDGADTSEEAYHKKPVDSENLAHLTIALPAGACNTGTCARPTTVPQILLDGATTYVGTDNRIKSGGHTITVNGATTTVTLAAKEKRSYVLAVSDAKCGTGTTSFGGGAPCPSAAVYNVAGLSGTVTPNYSTNCNPSYNVGTLTSATLASACPGQSNYTIYSASVGGRCINLASSLMLPAMCAEYVAGDSTWAASTHLAATDQAYLPGTYTMKGVTSQTFTLHEGDLSDFTIPAPGTFKTAISFVDTRDNPTAMNSTITSSCSGDRSYTIPATGVTALALTAFVASGCTYTFSAGGRSVVLSQSTDNNISLHRVDVDDVVVTREDGTTYTVKGSYVLKLAGVNVAGPLSTATGIDVLPGTYDLVTSYTTADGPQTQTDTFTL